jgi:hypothetical protein
MVKEDVIERKNSEKKKNLERINSAKKKNKINCKILIKKQGKNQK